MKNTGIYFLLICFISFWGCHKEDSLWQGNQRSDVALAAAGQQSGKSIRFTVRIANITSGGFVTPFAPGLWAVQKKKSNPLFIEGKSDLGLGLEALAEDGDPTVLEAGLVHHPKIRSRGIFNTPMGTNAPAPIFPGDAYEFSVEAKPNDFLNFATMFIQSNDLFVGPHAQGIALFNSQGEPISGDITSLVELWDAGTEINEEPGFGPNQAPRQSGPNTGPDEHGVVQIVHDGYAYPILSDILRITITPQN